MLRRHKKLTVFVSIAALLAMAGIAFAYFTTTGTGTGDAAVGTDSGLTIHQATITYSNGVNLLPGTSADVTFTVDNGSTGHQFLNTVSVTDVTSDKVGCNYTAHPTWFDISDTDVVNHDYAPGNGQAVAGNLTVAFNNQSESQDACKNATLTFHYASN